jgi:alpha-galactosidase
VIRKAVGEDVLLDKDGSPMLPPVGLVDAGRISADTSHSFSTTKAVAPGIAARFYMHRNYFLNDPDAFNVCAGLPVVRSARAARSGARPQSALTLQEAEASIVLSAISGGMYEIGDDLPILGAEKDRLELVKNPDLLDMAKVSRAATPMDLISYEAQDEEPSIFFLREDARQSILAVFNWTDSPRSHVVPLTALGLPANHTFQAFDVLNHGETVSLEQHALRLRAIRQGIRCASSSWWMRPCLARRRKSWRTSQGKQG